jgi:hypothetical protein
MGGLYSGGGAYSRGFTVFTHVTYTRQYPSIYIQYELVVRACSEQCTRMVGQQV